MLSYELITTPEELANTCAELEKLPVVGIDAETTALDPLEGRPRLLQIAASPERVSIIDLDRFCGNGALDPIRDLLGMERPLKVLHNAKFDYAYLRHHFGATIFRPWDTMLADQLLTSNHYARGLAAISQDYVDVAVNKAEQASDWSGELSPSQLEYAARDAAVLLPLYATLRDQLMRAGLREAAILEFDCVEAIAELELAGMPVDEPALKSLADALDESREQTAARLVEAFTQAVSQPTLFGAPEINLDSTMEVADLLRRMGVPIKDSTGDEELKDLAEGYAVVQMLRDYRGAAKLAGTYGRPLLRSIHPRTGRIHPDFQQIGAGTGRCSCNDPNLQNVPNQEAFRSCFAAPSGRVLIVNDYSQIELRILAYLSGDDLYAEAFRKGYDFHLHTALEVFGDEGARSLAKRLNFGVAYGLGVTGFARRAGITEERAKGLIDKYFGTYKNVDMYLKQSEAVAISRGEVRTASNRRVLYRFDRNSKTECSAVRRAARNAPIQGTNADILKRALHLIASWFRGTGVKLVNIVHDEIVVECDDNDAEEVKPRIGAAMLEAAYEYIPDIPVVVDQKITPRWVK